MPGNRPHHTDKFRSCVEKVKAQGHDDDSAYAICTTSLQKAGEPIFESAASRSAMEYKLTEMLEMRTCTIKQQQDGMWHVYDKKGEKVGAYDSELKALEQEALLQQPLEERTPNIQLHLCGALGKSRTDTMDGEEYLVIPVVALMEGVIHPVNAATPEFVPLETLRKAAASWNGRPITIGHPSRNGRQCSANDPKILDAVGIGKIFNSRVEGTRLLQEAWINKKKAQKVNPEMYARLASDKIEEVSVGAFVSAETRDGLYNGKPYKATWLSAEGDHLALLPGGRGACSVDMGCGACRAAEAYEVTEDGFRAAGGKGSGNFGHSGRPGQVGGSGDSEGDSDKDPYAQAKQERKEAFQSLPAEKKVEYAKYILGDNEDVDTWVKATLDDNEDYFDNKSAKQIRKAYEEETGNKPPESVVLTKGDLESIKMSMAGISRSTMERLHNKRNVNLSAVTDEDISEAVEELRTLIGARNNSVDAKTIQDMHDLTMQLGAKCDRSNYKMVMMSEKEMKDLVEETISKLRDDKVTQAE